MLITYCIHDINKSSNYKIEKSYDESKQQVMAIYI